MLNALRRLRVAILKVQMRRVPWERARLGLAATARGGRAAAAAAASLYDVLGVAPDASAAELKAAYRRGALACHPDTCAAPDAEARFRALADAYCLLRDDARRRAYDADLRRRQAGGGSASFHYSYASSSTAGTSARGSSTSTSSWRGTANSFWQSVSDPGAWGAPGGGGAPTTSAANAGPAFDARAFFRDIFGDAAAPSGGAPATPRPSPFRANGGKGQGFADWFNVDSRAPLRGVFDPPPSPWDPSKPPPPLPSKGDEFRAQVAFARERAARQRGGWLGGASELDRLTPEDWAELERIAKR